MKKFEGENRGEVRRSLATTNSVAIIGGIGNLAR